MTDRRFLIDRDRGAEFKPSHRLTTDVVDPVHLLVPVGALVEYSGEPHWHFQPLDAAANEQWLQTTARHGYSNIYKGRSMLGGAEV